MINKISYSLIIDGILCEYQNEAEGKHKYLLSSNSWYKEVWYL